MSGAGDAIYGTGVYGSAAYGVVGTILPDVWAGGRSLNQTVSWFTVIDGQVTTALEVHTSHGVETPVGQCSLVFEAPLPAHVKEGAEVDVYASNGAEGGRIFWGRIRQAVQTFDADGAWADVRADGWARRLAPADDREASYDSEVAALNPHPNDPAPTYSGEVSAASNLKPTDSDIVRLGNDTISNYAIPTPDGFTALNRFIPYTPPVNASYLSLTGRSHGVNTYPDTSEDPTNLTRFEVRLFDSPVPIGLATVPATSDSATANFADALDVNWITFELVIGAPVTANVKYTTFFTEGRHPVTGALDNSEFRDMQIRTVGPTKLETVMRGLFKGRGYGGVEGPPSYVSPITDLAGVDIKVGGNPAVDVGRVRIPAGQSWLSWATSFLRLFGYRLFDRPDGATVVRQLRGRPSTNNPMRVFTEGVNGMAFLGSRDIDPITTAWRVFGASGTALDGRTFLHENHTTAPATSPYVDNPPGVIWGEITDERLVNTGLCRAVRKVQEINTTDVWVEVEWETWGAPTINPGNVAQVESLRTGLTGPVWIMSVSHDIDDGGYWTRCRGWYGSGEVLPGSPDERTLPLPPQGTIHVGNQTIQGWEVPTPNGLIVSITTTADNSLTGLKLSGEIHDVTARSGPGYPSQVEIWQDNQRIGKMNLPAGVASEDPKAWTWKYFKLPASGQVHAGTVTLRIVAGYRSSDGSYDDYEIKNLKLSGEGVANPATPRQVRGRTDPVQPPAGTDYAPRPIRTSTPTASDQQNPRTEPRTVRGST
jgi:hypothetical protein